MIDTIGPQTYAVLDLPEPVASQVMDIRRRHQDAFRMALPAEVTVVGSSGVGCFAPGSSAIAVFDTLDEIAADSEPIWTSLNGVIRFPKTDIFAFRFTDEGGLRQLHERVATSGLTFEPNRWPFGPHVTLRSRAPVSDADAASLLGEVIPDEFELQQLSIYQLDEDLTGQTPVICRLLHRTRLRAEADR